MEKKDSSFEKDLEQLEVIVKDLENGNVDLDDAIKKFEDAMNLAKSCDDKLKKAESAISKIVGDDGSVDDFEVEE
ncbi:MAG: exodeoxyribonuclease VII small subunit [Bacilli bacterium]|nr:exodeoxyribonuclease VII small subunit [Bacilli bacterium]